MPQPRAFEPVTLTTERLTLRFCDLSDADALFALYSNTEAMRYWSTTPWVDPGEAHRKVERDDAHRAAGTALSFGLEMRDSGRLVGTCALHAFQRTNRRCEIGYLLAPSEQRKGLMREALSALLTYAFDGLDLHRIEADIDPANDASARILARLGFVREGLLRERWLIAGRWSDSVLFGLLKDEWRLRDPRTQPTGRGREAIAVSRTAV